MKKLIVLLLGMIVFNTIAQMAVHDESTRQQLYLNAKAEIAAIETSRKWLDLIIKHTGNTYNVSNSIEKIVESFKKEFGDLSKKVGDPKMIDTGVHTSPEANVTQNITLQKIRDTAKENISACDAEKLYGENSDPAAKYNVAENAYVNYENVLKNNFNIKRNLIAKRGALALALNNVRSLAETIKLNAAIAIINGKLATIQEQEQQALNKLLALQVRNDQKEKLQSKAKSKKFLMDFLNTDPFAKSSPGENK